MFVRTTKRPGAQGERYSVSICANHREGKKVYQEILCYLGTSDDPEKIKLMQAEGEKFIAETMAAIANPKIPKSTLSQNIVEVGRKNVGTRDVLGKLFDVLGFNKILNCKKLNNNLKTVVLVRFLYPSSKRETSFILERQFKETLTLDAIYYMMDKLVENLAISQKIVFEATKMALGSSIDLVLFDVTTLHLETVVQDRLRDFGYSKNNRMDSTQVTLALATTKEGLPIGYHLFPGSTAEVKTLMTCLNKWKEILMIREVIVVADRAMMSKGNIKQLREYGLKYIIACPLKKLDSKTKKVVLNKDNYKTTAINNENFLKQEIATASDERIIVTFS